MRLGIFGGSFDPVHRGHMALAAAARRELGLDIIYFIPARVPPHKTRLAAPSDHRLELLRRALGGKAFYKISPWETRRPGTTYTYETLRYFRRKFPRSDVFLILGGDSWKNFTTWKRRREILKNSRVVIGGRGGRQACRSRPFRERAVFLKTSLPLISSTEIRRRLARGISAAAFLPPGTASYIRRNGLYKNG